MKIAILGHSGSGKSTLARALGNYFNAPVLHLDTVQFEPGWMERDRTEARALVEAFLRRPAWVIDGNYEGLCQAQRMEQADHIVYLDFTRLVCLRRAYHRYRAFRGVTREDMAEGCAEKFDLEFLWWILNKGRSKKRRKHIRAILCAYPDKVVVLKNQRQANTFLRAPFDLNQTETS